MLAASLAFSPVMLTLRARQLFLPEEAMVLLLQASNFFLVAFGHQRTASLL